MALKSLFASRKRAQPKPDACTFEGAPAFALDAEARLAQIAMTSALGDLYYTSAEAQLEAAKEAAAAVSDDFLARAAIHARQSGKMKDLPAFLLALLSVRDPKLFALAFDRVVDDGRMLKTFVQIIRSGQAGRNSLGSRPKAMVAGWLNAASDGRLLAASVGNDPSLADVIRLSRPRPQDPARRAFYAWLIGKPADHALLPQPVQDWIAFQRDPTGPVPQVPFQMLTQLALSPAQWGEVARRGSWQMVRQGLNMFQRKGAFEDPETVRIVADMLADPARIRAAKAMPYQALAAIDALGRDAPAPLHAALSEALEIALANTPALPGRVVLAPDVSGSMGARVTGRRPGASSVVRFVDVAALMASALLRRNPQAQVLPFSHHVAEAALRPDARIEENAAVLSALLGGGTDCAAPLQALNRRKEKVDLVIYVSDNQSHWGGEASFANTTGMMAEWRRLKGRCPKARLVCIDIAPYGTTQAAPAADVLNLGGFSDASFDLIAEFAAGRSGVDFRVETIRAIPL